MCPEGAKALEGITETHVFPCQTESGLPNLRSEADGKVVFFHSPQNPIEEAQQWFKSLDLKRVDIIYIYGVGLGYYYQAAREWLKENPNRCLVFFEPDPQVIQALLKDERGTELLNDPQVGLYLYQNFSELNKIIMPYVSYQYTITALKSLENELTTFFKAQIGFSINYFSSALGEYRDYGVSLARNFLRNYLTLPKSYLANNLKDKFKNVPAIICGAGPSLDKNIKLLGSLTDKALIFAGGTALNALNGNGIMPHFGVGIDPNPDQFTRLVMNHAYELPFLYRTRMQRDALEMVHGDRLYVMGTPGYGLAKWLEKFLEFPENPEIEEGFNVLNFSLNVAKEMGCNPIILVGIDLAYTDGKSYASGILSHPIHNRQSNFRTKQFQEDLLSKKDIRGDEVYTLWKWVAESMWYGMFAGNNPHIKLVNSTEGGIGFVNVPNIPLEETAKSLLTKQYDFATWLQGEIQNSPLPQKATSKNILEGLQQLGSNLNTCLEHCNNIEQWLQEKKSCDRKSSRFAQLSKDISEEETKLFQQEAFIAILETFYKNYDKIAALDFLRAKCDEAVPPPEGSRPVYSLIDFERMRYRFIASVILAHKALFDAILEENKHTKAKGHCPYEHSLPMPGRGEQYSYEKGQLTLFDPEIKLDLRETLDPKTLEKEILYYPNGSLKLELLRRDGILHGPSTYFAENGKRLAQTWFWNGQQQGKMWNYYNSGELHSLQRFKEGLWEGKQEFFYKDGLPKSIFTYAKGQPHGEVSLFYPSGQLFRKLHFVDGKRQGQEQIWNESGLLIIEANYDKDHPIGTARQWHSNGILSKEIVYDEASNRLKDLAWDNKGHSLPVENPEEKDYFDQVTRQMGVLTESLTQMVGQLSKTLPSISDELKSKHLQNIDSLYEADLSKDFEAMNKELKHLQSLQQEMQDNAITSLENPTEPLWKTPQSQREMEKRLTQLGEMVGKDLETITSGLNEILKKMIPPPPKT